MRPATSVIAALSLVAVALLFSSCTTPDITDTLSSTTPGVWWGKDGTIKEEYKAIAFTTMNFDYVKQDLARGQGEHLASLATLMGVSESDQLRFFVVAQGRPAEMAQSKDATPAAVLMALHASWSPAIPH